MAAVDTAEINRRIPGEKSSLPVFALLAGWLVPGGGYLLTGMWIRAALTAVSVFGLILLGLGLDAKVYQLGTGDVLDMLGFVGQLGMGLPFAAIKFFSLGHTAMLTVVQEYGTKYLVCAGLLNVIAAIDAHALASGRKLAILSWSAPLLTPGVERLR